MSGTRALCIATNHAVLDGIRELQPFRELLETARSRHESARGAFRAAAGRGFS